MNTAHKARFERAGWKVGTASEPLGLTDAEKALVETKLEEGGPRGVRDRHWLSIWS